MAAGPWAVWGDDTEPVLSGVDYQTMKAKVDQDATGTLYGENPDTDDTYEG